MDRDIRQHHRRHYRPTFSRNLHPQSIQPRNKHTRDRKCLPRLWLGSVPVRNQNGPTIRTRVLFAGDRFPPTRRLGREHTSPISESKIWLPRIPQRHSTNYILSSTSNTPSTNFYLLSGALENEHLRVLPLKINKP